MGLNAAATQLVAVLQNPLSRVWQALQTVNPGWVAVLGVSVMGLYLMLLPFVQRTWRATGDEPHYLLTAHSLVTDGDFDLANNYDNFDYLAFYFSKDINRQIVTNRAGQQILNHQLGLPLIIVPAYALGGRQAVLLFQIVLGALLASVTFKLTAHISRNQKAAMLATLLVMFSPPLFMYHYLVYPELIGALLTTLILYKIISGNRPSAGNIVLIILALVVLPWLNRRFVPLAILLTLLLLWAWRQPKYLSANASGFRRNWFDLGRPTWPAVAGLVATVLSVAGLMWLSIQLNEPTRVDILAPEDALAFWHRLGRGVGWLVDQQRGLFIFGPIYILALWGLPLLLQNSWQRRNRHWFVLLPFLLSLGVTAAAGGYWVAWELGPRFLVIALPTLAPLLALAWSRYGLSKIWTGFALLLVGVSLLNSVCILRNPEMPYKSSLPLFYGDKLGLPLTEMLPDLAGYARISPAEADPQKNQVVIDEGQPAWFAPAGGPQRIAQTPPLHQLPFGHYQLTWPLRVEPTLAADTPLMRISAKFLGGGQLFNQIITAADLPLTEEYANLTRSFFNTNADRWRTPIIIHAVSTGESTIWGQDIIVAPDPFYAWLLPYLYLSLLVFAALFWYWFGLEKQHQPEKMNWRLPHLPKIAGWNILLLFPLLGVGWLVYQNNQIVRTYDADQLYHFTGRALSDPYANDSRAWLVDPMVDPPQKAMHGPFDIYDAGQYRVTFRLKLLRAVDTAQDIARLQVNATANLDKLVTQPLRKEHFNRPNLYHEMVLTITNPRRQALSFEVHYLGIAPLAIDEVTIEKISDIQ